MCVSLRNILVRGKKILFVILAKSCFLSSSLCLSFSLRHWAADHSADFFFVSGWATRKIMCWEKLFLRLNLKMEEFCESLRCQTPLALMVFWAIAKNWNAIGVLSIVAAFSPIFSFPSKAAVSAESRSQWPSHQKLFLLDEREREKNVKLNDNRKLMNSGNDVIANEWNFFCLRRPTFNKQWKLNNAASELLFEAKKKDPLEYSQFFGIHVWCFIQISGTNFSVGWLKLINWITNST